VGRALAVALLPYTWLVWRFWFTCDDAYITFRYAKHLARGDGLIFNPGESPAVEGYSNFLWTAFLALPNALGADVATVANVTSALCGLALVGLVAHFLRRRLGVCPTGASATATVLATLPPVAIWATSGLETMPFTLALFATFHALAADLEEPRWGRGALAGAAAVLLRADGFLWVALVLGAAACAGEARVQRAVMRAGAVAAATVALHFLWRHSYYGEWLPNTARVKAGFSLVRAERGWGYLVSLLLAAPSIAVLSLSGGLVRGGARGSVVLQALLVAFAGVGYAVFVGGDFMAMGRFLVPVMPFLALVFAAVSLPWALTARLAFAAAIVALNLLGCFDALPVPAGLRQHFHFRWNTAEARSEVEQWTYMKANGDELAALGRALALHTRPGESLIRSSVGGPGYFTELALFDRNGLVSPEVVTGSEPLQHASPGHDRRVEPSFFFAREPTYYSAKLIAAADPPAVGREAQRLIAEGRLEVLRHPAGDGIELQLLRFRRTP
jgi:hypothetical protein